MDHPSTDLTAFLPALHWVVPRLVEFARQCPGYPTGMGSRFLDLVVAQSINDVLGSPSTSPRMKGYWIGGYWPRLHAHLQEAKPAQVEIEFGQRTVCHAGEYVVSCDGVEHWEEFKSRMFNAAVAQCAALDLKVHPSQFILVDLQVGSFSLSSTDTDAAAAHLRWLLGCFAADRDAAALSSALLTQVPCQGARRL